VLEIKSSVDLIPFLIGRQPIRHGQYNVRTKFTNCYKSFVLLLCLVLSWTVLETGPWNSWSPSIRNTSLSVWVSVLYSLIVLMCR